jgi:hypothetical protein
MDMAEAYSIGGSWIKHDVGEQELLVIAGALKENKGLVDLQFRYDFGRSEEIWGAICDSLEKYPTHLRS